MPYIIKGNCFRWTDPSEGYQLQGGESFANEPPVVVLSHTEMSDKIRAEARVLRVDLFDLADGLQASYLSLGDTVNASTLETYKEGLRNATLANLSTCTTEDQMRKVFSDVYKNLKNALPTAIKIKFYQSLQ